MSTGNSTRPITFIFGSGRCGSTAFHKLLCLHRGTTWISPIAGLFPDWPMANRIAAALWRTAPGAPLVSRAGKPSECWGFWRPRFRGFVEPFRDLERRDVTGKLRRVLPIAVEQMLSGDRHGVLKLTGWPRIGFMAEIFPEARFVHIIRDGRAVANSLMNVDYWSGWSGPDKWRWGPLSEEQRAGWEDSGRSFAVLAGLQWQILMDAAEAARSQIAEERYLEVRFEDMASDTRRAMVDVCAFCDLEPDESFLRKVEARRPTNTNDWWRSNLPEEEQVALGKSLRDHLIRYGYETSA